MELSTIIAELATFVYHRTLKFVRKDAQVEEPLGPSQFFDTMTSNLYPIAELYSVWELYENIAAFSMATSSKIAEWPLDNVIKQILVINNSTQSNNVLHKDW